MDIIGSEIIHGFFGLGTITKFDGEYIFVDFPSPCFKNMQLSISSECMPRYKFSDPKVSNYLHLLSNKMLEDEKKKKEANKPQEIPYINSPHNLKLSDLPIHNMVIDGNMPIITVCDSIRSFCFYIDHIHEPRKHSVEMRNMIVGCLDRDESVNIGAEYCFDCNSYKIDKISILFYERQYGKLIYLKHPKNKPYTGSVAQASMSWDAETKLSRLGYNARANTYTELQRHRLLSYIIDNNIISYDEVQLNIKKNIDMKTKMDFKRCEAAIEKWHNDITFLETKYLFTQKATLGKLIQKT